LPPRRTERRLRDILEAVEKILRYVEGLDRESFLRDEKTVDAVLRNLSVIGEAARHLPEEFTATHPDLPIAEMRGMRHVVVHEYFGVSETILWQTVTEDLPPLVARLNSLLDPQNAVG